MKYKYSFPYIFVLMVFLFVLFLTTYFISRETSGGKKEEELVGFRRKCEKRWDVDYISPFGSYDLDFLIFIDFISTNNTQGAKIIPKIS